MLPIVEAQRNCEIARTAGIAQAGVRAVMDVPLRPSSERIRSGHHVNSVDEKLGRDARFFFVLAKSKEPTPGMITTDGLDHAASETPA